MKHLKKLLHMVKTIFTPTSKKRFFFFVLYMLFMLFMLKGLR